MPTRGNPITIQAVLDATPDTITITITDPDDTIIVNGSAMSLVSGFTYTYTYQTLTASVLGLWTVRVDSTLGAYSSTATTSFVLEEATATLIPTASDVRALLEGYCISTSTMTNAWIENIRDRFVIPFVEGRIRRSLTGVETIVEYHDGNGRNTMQLNRRGALSITDIEYVISGDYTTELETTDFLLLAKEGLVKAVRSEYIVGAQTPAFPRGDKNIKITYTIGYETDEIPIDLQEAVLYGTTEKALSFIAGRGGGGDVSVSGYSKSYGNRGKFTDIRNELARMMDACLHGYKIHTVGGK